LVNPGRFCSSKIGYEKDDQLLSKKIISFESSYRVSWAKAFCLNVVSPAILYIQDCLEQRPFMAPKAHDQPRPILQMRLGKMPLGRLNGINHRWDIMWVKQCHKTTKMTGNGKFIPPIKMVTWGMVYYYFTHINRNIIEWDNGV